MIESKNKIIKIKFKGYTSFNERANCCIINPIKINKIKKNVVILLKSFSLLTLSYQYLCKDRIYNSKF